MSKAEVERRKRKKKRKLKTIKAKRQRERHQCSETEARRNKHARVQRARHNHETVRSATSRLPKEVSREETATRRGRGTLGFAVQKKESECMKTLMRYTKSSSGSRRHTQQHALKDGKRNCWRLVLHHSLSALVSKRRVVVRLGVPLVHHSLLAGVLAPDAQ